MQTSFGEVAYFSLGVWPPKPENENKKLQEWNSPKQALYVVQWKKTRKWKNETAPNRLCMLSNESLDNYYHLLHHVFSLLCMDILDKLRPPHQMKKNNDLHCKSLFFFILGTRKSENFFEAEIFPRLNPEFRGLVIPC